jgi:uncharacterized protein (DUF736 family)
MTIIAKLTRQEDGRFSGTLSTLALHAAKLTIVPLEPLENEKAPVCHVFVGDFEAGAVWKKTSKAGNNYYSVKLDDPGFAQPIYCVLVKIGESYVLEWNRQAPRRPHQAAGADEIAF